VLTYLWPWAEDQFWLMGKGPGGAPGALRNPSGVAVLHLATSLLSWPISMHPSLDTTSKI